MQTSDGITEYDVTILDYNGNILDSMLIKSSVYSEKDNRYYYIKDLDSIKLNGDYITIDIYNTKKYSTVVGKLVINTNSKSRSIELKK